MTSYFHAADAIEDVVDQFDEPGSLVAGLLGMNVTVPLAKDDPLSFWIVVAGVLLFILALLVAARLRRWL